jgi:hypothetical protein
MPTIQFVNMAAGDYVQRGQKVSVKIKRSFGAKSETWQIPFGEAISYTTRTEDRAYKFQPVDYPDMKTSEMRAWRNNAPRKIYIIEHPQGAINQLMGGSPLEAALVAGRIPILRPIWEKF